MESLRIDFRNCDAVERRFFVYFVDEVGLLRKNVEISSANDPLLLPLWFDKRNDFYSIRE